MGIFSGFFPKKKGLSKFLLSLLCEQGRCKIIHCVTLFFFTAIGKAKLNYAMDKKVYVVLEEDGTEVDEEEYFQTLPANTLLMLLFVGDRWSPFGPPFT